MRRAPSAPLPSTNNSTNTSTNTQQQDSSKKTIVNDSIYVQAVVEAPTSVISNVDALSEKLNMYHQSVMEEKKRKAKKPTGDEINNSAVDEARFDYSQPTHEKDELVEMKKVYEQMMEAEERERTEARRRAVGELFSTAMFG